MTAAELRLAELRQEAALYEQNAKLYRDSKDDRLAVTETRLGELRKQIASLEPAKPAAK